MGNNPDIPILRLQPDEEVLSDTPIAFELPPEEQENLPPSSLKALRELAQVPPESNDILTGPVLAALPSAEHRNNPDFNLYRATFGRDSLRVAIDLVDRYPELTRRTLLTMAEFQGVRGDDIYSEEEPGRIVHEVRDEGDPVAEHLTAERGWHWPYYGSVDATPEFIRTLSAYCRSTQDYEFLHSVYVDRTGEQKQMVDALDAAVGWIFNRLDSNPQGLLEYRAKFSRSIENQVWKDSWDAYFHKDGTLVNHSGGVASVEVQAATMDALLDSVELYERTPSKLHNTAELQARAANLKRELLERFWVDEDGGFFILGTDRDERQNLRILNICTSNAGHLLHSRLMEGGDPESSERREKLVKRLFSPDMLSVNGIRTLSSTEARYRPTAYHNGSVWAWDNYLIAQGLEQHGYYSLSTLIKKLLLDGVAATNRFPEYWRGDGDEAVPHQLNTRKVVLWNKTYQRENVIEQPPQDIQAWTVAAIYAIKSDNSILKPTDERPTEPLEAGILRSIADRSAYWDALIREAGIMPSA